MPGSDPLWYCHECNAEMRPIVTSPEPLCASCNSSFIEQLPASDTPQADDPRAFNAMNRLFGNADNHDHDHDHDQHDHGVGGAIDPIGQLLGAVLGMRHLGPDSNAPREPARSGSSDSGTNPFRPTLHVRRDSDNSGRSRSGSGLSFSFRSGGSGASTGSGFGMFGGFGRREERQERQEPPGIEEIFATLLQGAQGGDNAGPGQGRRPPPLLQNMLMGLLGAGVGHPGVGMGASGDGRWGDYVLNQEALDQIVTQLMDANHSAPVPVPEDMLSTWPRTILTPGNPLESQDCAVCKESLTYTPPDPETDSSKPSGNEAQPQEALTLPCKHSFHVECIEPWVKVKGTCPVCRFELVPQNQRGEAGSRDSDGSGTGTGNGSGSGTGSGTGTGNWPGSGSGSGGESWSWSESGGGNWSGNGSGSRQGRERESGGGSGQGRENESESGRRGSPMPPGAYALD